MRATEELDLLIEKILLKKGNFANAYGQIIDNETIKQDFENHVGIKWQYCGIIAAYCSLGFMDINPCLRSKHLSCDRYYVNIFSELLTESIVQLEQVNNHELCRNERHVGKEDAYSWFEEHIGRTVTYPAFTSTSLNWQPVAERNMFKIKTKANNSKARKVIPVLEVFQPARATGENEILFETFTTFIVEKIERKTIYLTETERDNNSLILTNNYWEFDDNQLLKSNEE